MAHRGTRLNIRIKLIFIGIGLIQAGCSHAISFHPGPEPADAGRAAVETSSARKALPPPKAGDVLIAGGMSAGFKSTAAAEFFDPATNKFSLTRPMGTARAGAVGAPLAGAETKVLVAGGTIDTLKFKKHLGVITASVLNTAELYDPSTGTFEPTTGNMVSHRVAATETEFTSGPLAGQVLIAGGVDQNGNILNTAEIFDPATGSFTAVVNNMTDPRAFHTATLLNDGTVLVAGGARSNEGTTSNTADLFDPSTGFFSPALGTMNSSGAGRTATLLNDGTVLIAGGAAGSGGQVSAIASAEIYNPPSRTFAAVGATLNVSRALHTATLLADNTVLLAGGQNGTYIMPQKNQFTIAQGNALDSAEIFDPSGPSFTCVGGAGCPKSMVNSRMAHAATVLGNGKILLTGGLGGKKATQSQKALKTAEEFDPATKTFAAVGSMKKAHAFHVAAVLANVQ